MKIFSDQNDLFDFYSSFKGVKLIELYKIIENQYPVVSKALKTQKGVVGHIMEGLTGRAPNSDSRADLYNIGVELKVMPLRKVSNIIQPKERSKLKSINYNSIQKEQWGTSPLRTKMNCILFLTYEHPIGLTYKDWEQFVFKGPLYYYLQSENESIVREDWEGIKGKVINNEAHNLSESDGDILGACTSGTGKEIKYNEWALPAKQRSYSLKHSYLKQFYKEKVGKVSYESLSETIKDKSIVNYVLNELKNNLQNKSLNDLSNRYNIEFNDSAKAGFRFLINKIFKIEGGRLIREMDQRGIQIKTIPVNEDSRPWEAMSFPKFSLVDIMNERWDEPTLFENEEFESTFKNQINNPYIFIPIIKKKIKGKYESWDNWTVGNIILWVPSFKELEGMKMEWEELKQIIKSGVITQIVKHGNRKRQLNNLLKSKNTNYIHIRPHAKDSNDVDIPYLEYTKGRVSICWQSYWLNKKFISKLLQQYS